MTQVINARGTFTPLGVSRSSLKVSQSVAYALTQFYEMNQLQSHASQVLADFSGAEAGALSHCTASAITVSIAGLMTQGNQEYIEQLPNTQGMRNQVIILEDHVVNYGHSILQSIRLSGAKPLIVKGFKEYESALDGGGICGVLLVSSKLAQSQIYNFDSLIQRAHKSQISVIIDAAAQDFRIRDLIALQPELVLVSAQKYLAAPTAGLIFGKETYVEAARKQEIGIGRGMKPTKEAIVGVIEAIKERRKLDMLTWSQEQKDKNLRLIDGLNSLIGLNCIEAPDPTGLPFSRVDIVVNSDLFSVSAIELSSQLRSYTPSIWLNDQHASQGKLQLELVQLNLEEIDVIIHAVYLIGRR